MVIMALVTIALVTRRINTECGTVIAYVQSKQLCERLPIYI